MLVFTSSSWRSSILKSLLNTNYFLRQVKGSIDVQEGKPDNSVVRDNTFREEEKKYSSCYLIRNEGMNEKYLQSKLHGAHRPFIIIFFFKYFDLVGSNLSYYIMISGEWQVLAKLKLACGPGILDLSMSLYTSVLGTFTFFWGSSF